MLGKFTPTNSEFTCGITKSSGKRPLIIGKYYALGPILYDIGALYLNLKAKFKIPNLNFKFLFLNPDSKSKI